MAVPVGPVGRWGTLPPSVSDPAGPSVTGGTVGHLETSPSNRRFWWTLVGRYRHPTAAGCCSRLSLLAPVAYGEHCLHLILTLLARMARMVLVVPLATLGRCPRLLPRPRYRSTSSDLAGMRGPAPAAESAVLRGPVGPAVSSETLLLGVDVPGLCQIVLTVSLWPEAAVPLPAMWDPLFASLLVEPLKMTGADVVIRSRAVPIYELTIYEL